MSPDATIQINNNSNAPGEANVTGNPLNSVSPADPSRQIGNVVAHDLNNILSIVQGYADRLLLRHGANPALMPDLKLISEAARRAATVIRSARQQNAAQILRHVSPPPPAGN